jgi:hypothetical protein
VKILACVNHYFGQSRGFTGGSTAPDNGKRDERRLVLENTITALQALSENVNVRVCGISGKALIPIDFEFNQTADRPTCLIYESLNFMARFLQEYDYFINIEDDVLLPPDTFQNIVEFDRRMSIDSVFLPNRLEKDIMGRPFCVDLYCVPGWKTDSATFAGRELRVAHNPHSGVLVLSRPKFMYALERIDRTFRGIIISKEMESAFAHFHSPFKLFRSYSDPAFHVVYHQDRFKGSPNIIDESHPHHPYGFHGDWERPVKALLPDFIYRRLKYHKLLPRR